MVIAPVISPSSSAAPRRSTATHSGYAADSIDSNARDSIEQGEALNLIIGQRGVADKPLGLPQLSQETGVAGIPLRIAGAGGFDRDQSLDPFEGKS